MNEVSNVSDMAYGFREIAENQSREFSGNGIINYSYAFGALSSHMRFLLEELCLTDEQIRVMRNRLEREQDRFL